MMWLIMCKAVEDFIYEVKYTVGVVENYRENFLVNFELYLKTPYENTIIAMYYAFTSLSTVGFGDYNPRSDIERMACAFILLIGVMLFSTIMNGFIEMINNFKNYNAEMDDGDNLTRFFGILKEFNGKKPVEDKLKKQIEAHFDYKWKHDRNVAFETELDISLFE